jgi:hypothetical protein
MNNLEILEKIEKSPELKKQFVSRCIQELGVSIETRKEKAVMIYDDWDIITFDLNRDIEDVHDEIVRTCEVEEYNEREIIRAIIHEQRFEDIAKEYNVSLKKVRKLKQKLYESIKKSQ